MTTARRLLPALAFLLATLGSTGLFAAAPSPEKSAEIETLIKTTGGGGDVQRGIDAAIASLRGEYPHFPKDFWNEVSRRLAGKVSTDTLAAEYDKAFSLAELKAINAFYATEAGRKLAGFRPGSVASDGLQAQAREEVLAYWEEYRRRRP